MHKVLFLLSLLMLSVCSALAHTIDDEPDQTIRVGVFSNPPVAFKTEKGEWRGISIDILKAIAEKHGWTLEFVEGSFSDHLNNFEQHRIDLISMMAFSDERAKRYTFSHNSIISNWGVIYSRADSNIRSLLDLEGKKVGVMENNIHDKGFRQLAQKFEFNVEIEPYRNFSDVMEATHSGKVDAGVVNRLFGVLNTRKYDLVETGIIFNPINIHYATLDTSHNAALKIIDQQLSAYKSDKDSVYYSILHHWLNQSEKTPLPLWLFWVAFGLFGLIVVMSGLAFLLRHQVASRTSELQVEVNERRLAQKRLNILAHYDALTKLPNRLTLSDTLKNAIVNADFKKNKIAVFFIDIDRFKTVNDSLGHEAGDQLIVHIAQRLLTCLRGEDTINRFGGDEFVAILHDVDALTDVHHVAKRMLKCINTPIDIGTTKIYSSVCIGIAIYPDDNNGDDLLRYADTAMYHAKAQGGNNYQFYNEEFTQRVNNRLSLETRLRLALERDEFLLYYQPIFNLKDEELVGVEVLIRWQDPDRGLIMPDDFIPFAEETGLILPIGEWVMEHACTQVKQWELQGLGKINVAVNVSARQFENNKLHPKVISILQKSGLSAQQLELEITERMFLALDNNVNITLRKLMEDGVRLSIDDFGTGYSSLSALKKLPIDTLKIDRSFITGIPEDNDDIEIVATILAMARALRLNVIAEGIETEDQLNFLKQNGCPVGQGYFFSKPLPEEEMADWLKQRNLN